MTEFPAKPLFEWLVSLGEKRVNALSRLSEFFQSNAVVSVSRDDRFAALVTKHRFYRQEPSEQFLRLCVAMWALDSEQNSLVGSEIHDLPSS
jgi:hypothetical protein